MNELWKDIPNYEGLYQVSNLGRVKSTRRRGSKGAILRLNHTGKGYASILLHKDGVGIRRLLSRLILFCFVGPSDLDCLHSDGDKTNNRLTNLRYGTAKENGQDSILHGVNKGSRNGFSKLTEAQVEMIRLSSKTGTVLAQELNVSNACISSVRTGKTWKP